MKLLMYKSRWHLKISYTATNSGDSFSREGIVLIFRLIVYIVWIVHTYTNSFLTLTALMYLTSPRKHNYWLVLPSNGLAGKLLNLHLLRNDPSLIFDNFAFFLFGFWEKLHRDKEIWNKGIKNPTRTGPANEIIFFSMQGTQKVWLKVSV